MEHCYDNRKRWHKYSHLLVKIRRCGECTEDGCGMQTTQENLQRRIGNYIAEWADLENE